MLPNVDIIISKTEPLATEQIKWLSGLKRGCWNWFFFSLKASNLQLWWKFGKLRVQELPVCSIPGDLAIRNLHSWQVDAARARSYLLMQSRARMKKSLLSWCSSRRRAHCSNVTDMDVRSLALLQLVNLMPFNLRQIWRQARECWYSVRKSSAKCIVVFPGCPWQQCNCTTRYAGCSAGKCEGMCKARRFHGVASANVSRTIKYQIPKSILLEQICFVGATRAIGTSEVARVGAHLCVNG